MWELIRQNKRRSFILFILMGVCLILLGYLLGSALIPPPDPESRRAAIDGGFVGVIIAGSIWLILSLISFFAGDSIVLSVSGAKEVTPDIHPQLFNVVEEMKIAASLPAMPKVYIIDQAAPNAFATGRKPEKSAIAVTAGLLARLNRDELQGVVAHETGHILNRDILFVTFAGIMLGTIVIISQVFLRGMWFSGGSSHRYRSGSSRGGGGQAQVILMVAAIVLAILAPIMARLLYFAISRRREYLADATAVRLTRYPEGLASALEKISTSPEKMTSVSKAVAPMYIINPLQEEKMQVSSLLSTHPPIQERIRILRNIAQGAAYADYQSAYERTTGKKSSLVPPSELKDSTTIPIREEGSKTEVVSSTGKEKREIGDLIRAVNGFLFLSCACGLKIKVPPDFRQRTVPCPRCARELTIPVAVVGKK